MQMTEWIPAPGNWEQLQHHALADVITFGVSIDMDGLIGHMKTNGYDESEPIVIWRDKILDGRHRHASAIKAGVTPVFVRFVGKSAEAYVAKKAFRQHLNASQRAMIAGIMTSTSHGGDRRSSDQEANLPLEKAANSLNVSERSVKDAKKVITNGTPVLQDAVKSGEVSVSDAAKIVDEPPKVQNEAVKKVKAKKAKTVKAAVEDKPKSGKTRFNENSFEKAFGGLVRIVDARGNALGKDKHFHKLHQILDQFLAEYKEWKKVS